MTRKTKIRPEVDASSAEIIKVVAYKGFDAKLECRGHQFEAGKTYRHVGAIKVCDSGFHACLNPLDVFGYYPPLPGARYAEVAVWGNADYATDDTKIATEYICITKEITIADLTRASARRPAPRASAAASTTGKHSIACSLGIKSVATAGQDGWIVLAAWVQRNNQTELACVRAAKVGGPDGIKPGVTYRLTADGAFQEAAP